MTTPRIMLATLCLNEMEWLPKLYQQHKDWPGLVGWVFVESADAAFALANPERVTKLGLSVDGTTDYLSTLDDRDSLVKHVQLGISSHNGDRAQGKCASRNEYLKLADQVRPDFVFVLDADEFYTRDAQKSINTLMLKGISVATAFCFKQRHLWRPESCSHLSYFSQEVVGGFWGIPHCRGWRYVPGMRYQSNHNTPEDPRRGMMDRGIRRYDLVPNTPQCQHMGYASKLVDRAAKNRYYEQRGESVDPKRRWYTESRAAFETWKPGGELPRDALVVPYSGPIPECFKTSDHDDS